MQMDLELWIGQSVKQEGFIAAADYTIILGQKFFNVQFGFMAALRRMLNF